MINGEEKELVNSMSYMVPSPSLKDSPAWLEQRRNHICGSEIAALMGVDDHTSRKKLLESKLTGVPVFIDEIGRRMCDYGCSSEEIALCYLKDFFPKPVISVGVLVYKIFPILEGTPDGLTVGDDLHWIPIEIKTRAYPNPVDAVPYPTKWDVPLKHWIQLAVYILMVDASQGYLVNYTACHGMSIFQLKRDMILEHYINIYIQKYPKNIKPRVNHLEKEVILQVLQNMVRDNVSMII
jgi:hypothetical protein